MSLLQTIRDRAQGIMAWVLLIVVGVPFVLWGIQNYIDVGKEKPAAVVGDRELFDRDVSKTYERMLSEMGDAPDIDEKQLRKEALDQLVTGEVISQSAVSEGLAVSDEEVRELIQTMPYFQVEGQFDKEKYRNTLASQRMTPPQFVARIKSDLITQQFQQGVLGTAFTTPREVETLMRLKNQIRLVDYLELPVRPAVKAFTDEDLRAYLATHAEDFRTPERVAVDYLMIELETLARKVEVDEAEVKKLYEEQKSNFGTAERRKVSHILIAADPKDPEGQNKALTKAQELRDRLMKGEEFSLIASQNSADTVSAKVGGDLGYLMPEAQEPSFSEAAEKLALNEVSAPVKTSFGYHLIKLTSLIPASYKPYEAVRAELRIQAQKNKAEAEFYAKGQRLAELTFEHSDTLEVAASELGLKVEQTPLFTRAQGTGIAEEEAVRKVAFSPEVLEGKNSEPVELGNERAVVVRLRSHEVAADRSFESVRAEILARLKAEEGKAEVTRIAEALVQKASAGDSLESLAKSQGLAAKLKVKAQRTTETIPFVLLKAIFDTDRPSPERPSVGQAVSTDGSRYVFSVISVTDGDSVSKDPQEQASANQYMERGYGQLEYQSFVSRLREMMRIEIKSKE